MLDFCDSFDGYTAIADKWLSISSFNFNGNGAGIASGSARSGTQGMRIKNDQFGNPGGMRRTRTADGTVIFGIAYKRDGLGAGDFLAFYEGGTRHFRVQIESNNKLGVYRDTTKLGEGVTAIPQNVWTYIEIKLVVHDTTGTVDLQVNGGADLSLTGQDTRNGGTGVVDDVRVFNVYGQNIDVDDCYCLSGTTAPNTLLGDIKVECLVPNGDGNSSQLVGSDGNSTNNSLLVDEIPPNGDTDYVESATVGNKDTYAYGNLATTAGTVHAVQVSTYARKTDAGTRKIASVARSGGTEVDSSDLVLSTSYQYFVDVRATKPGGGSWAISDVNAAEFGVKVTA